MANYEILATIAALIHQAKEDDALDISFDEGIAISLSTKDVPLVQEMVDHLESVWVASTWCVEYDDYVDSREELLYQLKRGGFNNDSSDW